MNKKMIPILIMLSVYSLAARNKINYCANYYQSNFNNIISLLFQPINNQEIQKYEQTKNLISIKNYLEYIPYNEDIVNQYIFMLIENSEMISKIKSRRTYEKARKEFIRNSRKLLLNIVLINEIDLYQKFIKLDESSLKFLKRNIIPDILIYIWNNKYKQLYNKDLISFEKISKIENMIYSNDRKILHEVKLYYPYLIYYSYVLKDNTATTLLSNKKIQAIIKRIIQRKYKYMIRTCFSSKRFNKMENKYSELNNQEIFNLFNIYIYLKKDPIIYNYVMSHKMKNHLWIYLDAIYDFHQGRLERAYKEFLILLKSEPKNNFLAKFVTKTSLQIILRWNKDPNNYYKIWFYLTQLFKELKPYKEFLLKNKETNKYLMTLLEIYQKNSVILKEYWMNENIPDNVIKVHNKTKYYLDFFANK